MSDPTLSDIDFKNKMAWVWTTLNGSCDIKPAVIMIKKPDFQLKFNLIHDKWPIMNILKHLKSGFWWQIFCDEKVITRSGSALIFNRKSSRLIMLLQFQWYPSFRFSKFIFYIFNRVTYRIRIIFNSKTFYLRWVFNIWFITTTNSYIAAKYRRFFLVL